MSTHRTAASPRRHPLRTVAIIVVIVAALAATAAAGTAFWLNQSLSNIRTVELDVGDQQRPARSAGDGTTILLLGADAGTERDPSEASILDAAASDSWPRGVYRSDATMLVHVDADRESAQVVSIPRDSYLPVYDATGQRRETTKVNAALSLYGPAGALRTIEEFAGVRIDHLAMVDWDGFEAVTDAVGGVELSVPGEGTEIYDGADALDYVRVRKTLPNGDFDRVRRQQNFLRAVMSTATDRELLANPIRLKRTLDAVTSHLAVDDGWSDGDIRSLVISLRAMRPRDLTFLTIPTDGTADDPQAGSIVVVDEPGSRELFTAMRDSTMDRWVGDHREATLGPPEAVE